MTNLDPADDFQEEAIQRLRDLGGDELLHQVVHAFLGHAPGRVADSRSALDRGDLEKVAEALHGLTASAANLGGMKVAALSRQGLEAIRSGEHQAVAVAVRALEASFPRLVQWLYATVDGVAPEQGAESSNGDELPLLALVEDNADNRLLLRAILKDRYRLAEFENGVDALAALGQVRPALILLDIALPGMDGLEVLEHLKADESLKEVPVVALTAHAMSGDRERLLAAGFRDYFAKPIVDPSQLLELIENLLS